jgi:hypothetical protein
MKVYYFGCIDRPGHFMHAPHGYDREASAFTKNNPWGYKIDSRLCPDGPEVEGRALVHHKDGWTALSFWDRSVDRRGKCNSNFLAEGTHDFAAMVKIAQEHFPRIMGRFSFPIVEATNENPAASP